MADPRWAEIRRQYGDVYITTFPDGLIVPWKPLSIGEYLHFENLNVRLIIPPACVENEIFTKCVQDQHLIRNLDTLKAGVVTTVVHHIWLYSGPNTPQKLKDDFENAREKVKNGREAIIHQCAYMIATGFNYTLEQVYAMDYETFLLRLAQAEAKLLTMGLIREPLSLNFETDEPKLASLNQPPKRVKVDAKEAWEKQQRAKRSAAKTKSRDDGRWWKISPVLEAERRRNIHFESERAGVDDLVLDTHERNEKGEMRQHLIESKLAGPRAKMIEDAKIIYKDLIHELGKSKK